jgi:copper homeostasis protein
VLVEACVDSVESAMAAARAGANRLELCDNLADDGTTPSAGAIAECRRRVAIPLYVMIRPRGGDFVYSDVDFEVMHRDIAHARQLGADGVVLGLLQRNGRVDAVRTAALVRAARPLDVTFHRAIDAARDPSEALDALVMAGVDRVLTSGRARTARQGARVISELVARAGDRIAVMAGGGIDAEHVRSLVKRTGVREVHVRATDGVRLRRVIRRLSAP